MALTLGEIPNAIKAYMNDRNKVAVQIAEITPSGTVINPNETFTIAIKACNNEGGELKNVRYHLNVIDATVGKLIVHQANDRGLV